MKTYLYAHSGGNAGVGTVSNHDFQLIANGSKRAWVSPNGDFHVTGTVHAKGFNNNGRRLEEQVNELAIIGELQAQIKELQEQIKELM